MINLNEKWADRNKSLNFDDYRTYYNDGWFTTRSTRGLKLGNEVLIHYTGYRPMYYPNSVTSRRNIEDDEGNSFEVIMLYTSNYAYGVDADGFELCDLYNLDNHYYYEETDMRSIFFREVNPVLIKGPNDEFRKKVMENY